MGGSSCGRSSSPAASRPLGCATITGSCAWSWSVRQTTPSRACCAWFRVATATGRSWRTRASPPLAALHVPRPVGCVPSGAPYVTNGSGARHVVALTFDDGPWPDTPQFLSVLEREHVHATFFQLGSQIASYGRGVDQRMLADGDIIGDHTWDHRDVAGDGPFASWEISSTRRTIAAHTGFTPCLFRAPYGA